MIKSLSITNYKNYDNFQVEFVPKLNFITGLNGTGKTNLIDAIHYLCITKSFTTSQDRNNVKFGSDFFRLHGFIQRLDKTNEIEIKVQPGKRKEVIVDGAGLDRLSDHLGYQPVIILSPSDQILVDGVSAERRRFMDFYLCQTDKNYLSALQAYSRLLIQRNAYLKSGGKSCDTQLLVTYSQKMLPYVDTIQAKRGGFVSDLLPHVKTLCGILSGLTDDVGLQYAADLKGDDFMQTVTDTIDHDRLLMRTTRGIHRDDMKFQIENRLLRRFGSQGQRKSYLIALHLSIYNYLREHHAVQPVVLLDDIFDKLDNVRVDNLLNILSTSQYGQVFISDARLDRVQKSCEKLSGEIQIIEISQNEAPAIYTKFE